MLETTGILLGIIASLLTIYVAVKGTNVFLRSEPRRADHTSSKPITGTTELPSGDIKVPASPLQRSDEEPIVSELRVNERDVSEQIREWAALEYPNDYATQRDIIEEQTSAFKKLSSYTHKSVPQDILKIIATNADREYPNDYAMQLHIIEEQTSAFQDLSAFSSKSVPQNILKVIAKNAKHEYPTDYSTQLHVVEEQVSGFLKIRNFPKNLVPSDVFERIHQAASAEYPNDYSMQLFEIEEQTTAYRSL